MHVINRSYEVPADIARGLTNGTMSINGAVVQGTDGKIIRWLQVVNPDLAQQPQVQPIGGMPLGAEIGVANIVVQMATTAVIMHKLGKIDAKLDKLLSIANDLMRKVDTIEWNQWLEVTKHYQRAIESYNDGDLSQAMRDFRILRSDVWHFLSGNDPVHLMANYHIPSLCLQVLCLAEPYEEKAAIDAGVGDVGKVPTRYIQLVQDVIAYLDLSAKYTSQLPTSQLLAAMRNHVDHLQPAIDQMPQLELYYEARQCVLEAVVDRKLELPEEGAICIEMVR